MSSTQSVYQIEYPESDGKPMGETDLHRDWMVRILDILRYRYRGQQVYVASDLLVYFEEGAPRRFVVPDDFVVLDCHPGPRRVFKTWEDGKAPDVVFEVTSRGTRQDDESFKPQIYERIGVREYFLFDPTSEYLRPPLQGFRQQGVHGFVAIAANADGSMTCESLGIVLSLDSQGLIFRDLRTGAILCTEAEAECAARQAAESRVAELEAELNRLRRQLGPSE